MASNGGVVRADGGESRTRPQEVVVAAGANHGVAVTIIVCVIGFPCLIGGAVLMAMAYTLEAAAFSVGVALLVLALILLLVGLILIILIRKGICTNQRKTVRESGPESVVVKVQKNHGFSDPATQVRPRGALTQSDQPRGPTPTQSQSSGQPHSSPRKQEAPAFVRVPEPPHYTTGREPSQDSESPVSKPKHKKSHEAKTHKKGEKSRDKAAGEPGTSGTSPETSPRRAGGSNKHVTLNITSPDMTSIKEENTQEEGLRHKTPEGGARRQGKDEQAAGSGGFVQTRAASDTYYRPAQGAPSDRSLETPARGSGQPGGLGGGDNNRLKVEDNAEGRSRSESDYSGSYTDTGSSYTYSDESTQRGTGRGLSANQMEADGARDKRLADKELNFPMRMC